MDYTQFRLMRCHEDTRMLEGLEQMWLGLQFWKTVETDPFERMYARRLERTADELIIKQQAKMVRRYL